MSKNEDSKDTASNYPPLPLRLLKRYALIQAIFRLIFQAVWLALIGGSSWFILNFVLEIEPVVAFFLGFIFAGLTGFLFQQVITNQKIIATLFRMISILPPHNVVGSGKPHVVGMSMSPGKAEMQEQRESPSNPYIVGAPVPPDKFFGRQKMLQKILASIRSGNHIAIYGERRIGKTSLLHRLEHLLRKETSSIFIPTFVQIQILSEEDFFGALIDEVLKAIPNSVKVVLPPLVRQTLPQSYKGVNLLQDLETVIQAWNNEAAKPIQLIFLLDEGDRLNEFSEETQMQLRGLLQKPFINQHVRLVWSGVRIDRTWHSDTSPWFNLFKDEFHVSSLEPEEARRLILEPVAGIYDYEAKAVTKILGLTQSKPYLIQRLCSSCIDYIQEQDRGRGRIALQDVEAVWADLQERDERAKSLTYETTQSQVQIAESQTKYETTGDS